MHHNSILNKLFDFMIYCIYGGLFFILLSICLEILGVYLGRTIINRYVCLSPLIGFGAFFIVSGAVAMCINTTAHYQRDSDTRKRPMTIGGDNFVLPPIL